MEEKVLKKIMQEVEEELEQTKRRIFWKLTEMKESNETKNNKPNGRRSERGFFSLD